MSDSRGNHISGRSHGSPVEPCAGGRTPEDARKAEQVRKDQEEKPVRLRCSLFFDGTLNNKSNVAARKTNDAELKDKFDQKSYDADYTNVAKLERYVNRKAQGYDGHSVRYIEGIGTLDYRSDSLLFGAGLDLTRGSKAKAEAGIRWVVQAVSAVANPSRVVQELRLDLFGFSRGASAARHFIHLALAERELEKRLQGSRIQVQRIDVRFVGLFDTVASHGFIHSNDTEQLHLDSVALAERVVQLVADDEYRANFALTNIASAGGKGEEISLPGAHSDVGGGYRENLDESRLLVVDLRPDTVADEGFVIPFWVWPDEEVKERLRRERRWLIDQGWCRDEDFDESSDPFRLVVTRRKLHNQYSRIPLRIMAKWAKDGGLEFEMGQMEAKQPIGKGAPILAEVFGVIGEDGKGNWRGQKELLRKLRHRFCHFSSKWGDIVDGPRYVGEARKRKIYEG